MISERYRNDGRATLELNQLQIRIKQQIETKIDTGHYRFEQANCPVCTGSNFQTLAEKDRYGLACQNVVCCSCGLVMINPRLSDSSYNEFYDQEYRPLYTGKNANAANFFQGQLKRGQRLYQFLQQRDLLPSKKQPFVFEVGCGAGGILSYFAKQGFRVKGIDLGAEYLTYGVEQHGLDLQVGTIHDIELDTVPDLVIYSHVIEHIPDPNLELLRLTAIVGPESLVYVEVPGIKNLSLGYRKDPLRYFQNAHTYSFSLTSLNNLFANNGFHQLTGNEFVKAVFRKQSGGNNEIVNDYQPVTTYLQKMERARKYYKVSMARFQIIGRAAMDRITSIIKR